VLDLCDQLMTIDLKYWETLIVDTTEIYSILNYWDIGDFTDRICSLYMIDDYFGRIGD